MRILRGTDRNKPVGGSRGAGILIGACLGLVAPLWLSPSAAHARVVEKIAAVVGDDIILASEVEERAAPFMRQIAGIASQTERASRAAALRREVLDRLIDEVLITQQADELKMTVSSEEIDRSVETIKRENNLNDEQLRAALAGQGMTMASYRQDVKKQILRFRVLQGAVQAKIQISERELQAYYDRHIKGGSDSEVRASHIFLTIPENADAGAVIEKQKSAEALRDRAVAGEDFAKLAREYSEDSATRDEGGDLGFFGRDLLPKAIEEAVFNMKVGEVQGPVRVGRGFHVIKLTDRRTKEARPFEDMRNELAEKLRNRAMEKQTKSFLAELRKKAMIDIRL